MGPLQVAGSLLQKVATPTRTADAPQPAVDSWQDKILRNHEYWYVLVGCMDTHVWQSISITVCHLDPVCRQNHSNIGSSPIQSARMHGRENILAPAPYPLRSHGVPHGRTGMTDMTGYNMIYDVIYDMIWPHILYYMIWYDKLEPMVERHIGFTLRGAFLGLVGAHAAPNWQGCIDPKATCDTTCIGDRLDMIGN